MLSPAAVEAALTSAQEVLVLAERMRPGTVLDPRCTVSRAYLLPAAPDLPRLEAALTVVVARHDALRTVPVLDGDGDGDGVRAVVLPPGPVALQVRDLGPEPGDAAVRRAVQAAAGAPYDLEAGPLARVHWLSRGPGGVLVVGAHHWAADAAGLDALQRDLTACYDALGDGRSLPAAPGSPAEVAGRPRDDLDAEAVAWWRQRLRGARRGSLPVQRADGVRSATTELVSVRFAPPTSAALLALAGRLRASPYMVVLATLAALLDDGRGERDRDLLVFGTDPGRSGRTRDVVGFLTEPLPLRLAVSLDAPLSAAVEQSRASVLGALAHRQVPFLRLLEAAPRLAVPLLSGRRPMTLVQHVVVPPLRLGPLTGTALPTFEAVTSGERSASALPLDLDLTVEQIGSGHSAGVLHDPGLWTTAEVEGALATMEQVLQRGARDESTLLGDLLEAAR